MFAMCNVLHDLSGRCFHFKKFWQAAAEGQGYRAPDLSVSLILSRRKAGKSKKV